MRIKTIILIWSYKLAIKNQNNQVNKFWLHTDTYQPDEHFKWKTMDHLGELFVDFFSFVFSINEDFVLPSFEDIFFQTEFYDYLKLMKKELKIVLINVITTEHLTGVFTGLLGHEMTFGKGKDGLQSLTNNKKEFLMLHSLKLLDIAYQEQFHLSIPLPDEYREWIDSTPFPWETYVKDLE